MTLSMGADAAFKVVSESDSSEIRTAMIDCYFYCCFTRIIAKRRSHVRSLHISYHCMWISPISHCIHCTSQRRAVEAIVFSKTLYHAPWPSSWLSDKCYQNTHTHTHTHTHTLCLYLYFSTLRPSSLAKYSGQSQPVEQEGPSDTTGPVRQCIRFRLLSSYNGPATGFQDKSVWICCRFSRQYGREKEQKKRKKYADVIEFKPQFKTFPCRQAFS